MKNQLATIAALPSGAGCAAALQTEVGAPRVDGLYSGWGERIGDAPGTLQTDGPSNLRPGETFIFQGVNYRVLSVLTVGLDDVVGFERDDRFPAIDADMLDTSKGAA